MMGGGKRVLDREREVRRVSRQSLVAAVDVAAGERVERHHLTCQRPGVGIAAAQLDKVVGRVAGRPIAAGTMLDWTDFALPLRTAA